MNTHNFNDVMEIQIVTGTIHIQCFKLTPEQARRLRELLPAVSISSDNTLTVLGRNGELSEEGRRRRLHDHRTALNTLQSAVDNLNDGYRFDDNYADLKLIAIERALGTILSFSPTIEALYAETKILE